MTSLHAISVVVGCATQLAMPAAPQPQEADSPAQLPMSPSRPVAFAEFSQEASTAAADPGSPPQRMLIPSCDQDGWFDPAPRRFLPDCGGTLRAPACLPVSPADVDGDGKEEVFTANPGLLYQNDAVTETFPLLIAHGITRSPAGVAARTTDVLQSAGVANWSVPMVGGTDWSVSPPPGYSGDCRGEKWLVDIRILGWLDCDEDGDLDLVAQVYVWREDLCWCCGCCQYCWPCTWTARYPNMVGEAFTQAPIWFENIRPPNRVADADLNHDGVVDGADLGILLNSWGRG